ncbi:MAG: hypothetical protein ACLQK4_11910 [Acidimicrobiales bacterium]|jgi:hypothetical protein
MSESQIFDGDEPVIETDEGFRDAPPSDASAIDSEIDFDDEAYEEADLIGEKAAGNAEGGMDGHLDDPEKVAGDDSW